jgi:bifunctional non-homologous end joining protein LigD
VSSKTLRFGPYAIECNNLDKLFFPDAGLSKGDLVDYYADVADTMLPHLADRPLTMHRFPDGIQAEGFYQKDAPDYFPDWIDRATLPKQGGVVRYVLCNKAATLVYLANQACITPHVWLARADRPRHPDRLIFDLDPPKGRDFGVVRDAARAIREALEELGLVAFALLTGSRGVHVTSPLDRSAEFDAARAFARDLADWLAHREPKRWTTKVRKLRRRGRLYLDTGRNAYGQTGVTPYAVRAKPGAPVATPVDWEELADPDLRAGTYTITNIRARLAQRGDPWKEIARHARSLDAPRRALAERRESEGLDAKS